MTPNCGESDASLTSRSVTSAVYPALKDAGRPTSGCPFQWSPWMHEYAGLEHEYWLNRVCGVGVVLVCVGLLVLGGSGIYLWFKIHEERLVGSLLLAIGLGYGLTLITLIRLA